MANRARIADPYLLAPKRFGVTDTVVEPAAVVMAVATGAGLLVGWNQLAESSQAADLSLDVVWKPGAV